MADKAGKIATLVPVKGTTTPLAPAYINRDGARLDFGGFDPNMIGSVNMHLSFSGTAGMDIGVSGSSDMAMAMAGDVDVYRMLTGSMDLDLTFTGRLRKLIRQDKFPASHRIMAIGSDNAVWYEVV